jgi:hypothetical protein
VSTMTWTRPVRASRGGIRSKGVGALIGLGLLLGGA